MRVAIDVSPLKSAHQFRGVGSYTRCLVEALRRVDKKNKYLLIKPQTSNLEHNFDLIHYPYFDLFQLTLPLQKPCPTVVTVHDLIPLVFPDKFPKGVKGWFKYQIQKQSLRHVQAIITDSQNSKKDIASFIGFPKEKIHVIPLAPAPHFKPIKSTFLLRRIEVKYKLPKKFVLYVGDVNWNKNVLGLVKAFSTLKSQFSNLKLVLVGKAFMDKELKETKEALQLIKELNLINQIKILGFVPTEDLVAIYNLATVYCQPSFYEGFGLPVLEAFSCGCPVVAAKTSSLPEICGRAALMVNPDDTNDIARGLAKVVYDKMLRTKLIEKGTSWVKNFTWEKTARQTLGVYQKVCKVSQ